ncbi:MAG: adenosylcobinamide-GDP ribazoletransferase [Methanomassiliicoccaceae archaeon]|jgi:adenosylcobinamide-GDP ribazoletransferase|nr:adenosylcobinamide-GDP ribazoletransferase [Methanomassiliicoccaceae archaeon]
MGSLKAMFSFFTMIRLDITQDDMDAMDRRFWMVPTVGVLYGLIAAAMMLTLTHYIAPLAASVVTFFVIFAFNRFLHIDGTIDTGDGIVVAGTKEDHLRALKDSRIGAGGMAFALMVILMSITMAAAIWIPLMALLMFSAEVLAKVGMVSAAAFGEPGNGMAGNSVRNTTPLSLLYAILLAVMFMILFGAFIRLLQEHTALPVMLMDNYLIFLAASLTVSVLTGLIMSAVAKKNFGMVNGDVLGATNEITRATVLLTFLILISVI